jgi:serine/threonine-protein kinase HipA
MLLAECKYFALSRAHALSILEHVLDAVLQWKRVALTAEVGLTAPELDALYDAFEHDQTDDAREALGRPRLRPKVGA